MTFLEIAIPLAAVSFFLNFVWEVWHSELYTTCHKMRYLARIRLLTIMSLKDAFFIVLFYYLTVLLFGTVNILENAAQFGTFVLSALAFSFADEKISVRMGRWEYAETMPTLWGVGITPFLEVAVTGAAALWVLFGAVGM